MFSLTKKEQNIQIVSSIDEIGHVVAGLEAEVEGSQMEDYNLTAYQEHLDFQTAARSVLLVSNRKKIK